MSGFGNTPGPSQNKPFTIPGPYSGSGQFDPGVANILESGRLARLKQEREAHAPAAPVYQESSRRSSAGSPPTRQRSILVRLLFGIVKWAIIGFLILMALAIIGRIVG
ncbi:MAG: hypothetical protein ACKOWF_00065 [Chloroflexota bacterium]